VTGYLIGVNAVLAVMIVLIVLFILGMRLVVIHRMRRDSRFRPAAELAIAEHLAGIDAKPAAGGRDEREVLLTVAVQALADLRGSERARLVTLLEQLGFVDEAVSRLRARRWVTRRRAAETLAAIGTPTAAVGLRTGLHDRDALVRTTCARTLAEVAEEDAVPEIAAVAERDAPKVPGAAAAVVLALAEHRSSALAPLLAGDAAPEVRLVALTLAGELRLTEHSPALRVGLSDRDDVAATAATGLGHIGDIEAVGALVDLAGDEGRSQAARAAAIKALGAIGQASTVPALEAQLRASDWVLQAAAAQALTLMGEPGEAALRQATASDRQEVRELAEAALEP
jgi:HEAT repeat protein